MKSGSGLRSGSGRAGGGGRHGGGSARGQRQQQRAAEKALRNLTRAAAGKGSPAQRAASAARRAAGATGRGIGKGLGRGAKAGAPHAARAATWAGRHARRAASASRDGVIAGVAGLGAALWSRSIRAGWQKALGVWRRRRDAARDRRAARKGDGTDMTGPAVAATPGPLASFVRRPATAGGTPSSPGGLMSGHHFTAPAMEMARVAANYEPRGMLQVAEDFAALPEALGYIAEAMKISVARADQDFPLDDSVVDIMRQVHGLQIKAAELAEELAPVMRRIHAPDLARIETPRKGIHAEAKWDVTNNI
ncbi:hypothetical protein [Streptomyces sp. Z26]|uniref:hypothetical protein n=1 Tax=Streptomyces sp. Z26 TaxID=2500177 RepID=UPI000EF16C8F|nr:hypothetical protein [Streptomyces sp. Z26]RLL67006.1 hypothetical protein D7M15_09155 [Streptomyces sp. Z26]